MLLVRLCRGTDFSGIEGRGALGQCLTQCPVPRASATPQARKEEAFALGQNQHSRSDPRAPAGSPASFKTLSLLFAPGVQWALASPSDYTALPVSPACQPSGSSQDGPLFVCP